MGRDETRRRETRSTACICQHTTRANGHARAITAEGEASEVKPEDNIEREERKKIYAANVAVHDEWPGSCHSATPHDDNNNDNEGE